MNAKRIKFYFFIGIAFLMYAVAYFPVQINPLDWRQITIDILKSVATSFVIVYIAIFWLGMKIDRQKSKEPK